MPNSPALSRERTREDHSNEVRDQGSGYENGTLAETEGASMGSDTTELHLRLQELERRERELSKLRRRLHDRLDTFPNEAIQARERQVSAGRRALHLEIDTLRGRLNIQ